MVEAAVTALRIRPRLAAVWFVLAVLIGVVVAIEYNDRASDGSRSGEAERSGAALVPVPMDDLGAVEVGQAGVLHRFERGRDGIWFYHGAHGSAETAHEHRVDPAKAEVIAKGLAGLTRARIERRLPPDPSGAQYGLAAPKMLLVIYRINEPRPFAQYAVGEVAPDSFSRYVQKAGSAEVVTIANYQIENLAKLVETMRN